MAQWNMHYLAVNKEEEILECVTNMDRVQFGEAVTLLGFTKSASTFSTPAHMTPPSEEMMDKLSIALDKTLEHCQQNGLLTEG